MTSLAVDGVLAAGVDTGSADRLPVSSGVHLRCSLQLQGGEAAAQKRQRVSAQGERGVRVVGNDVLAFRRRNEACLRFEGGQFDGERRRAWCVRDEAERAPQRLAGRWPISEVRASTWASALISVRLRLARWARSEASVSSPI